MKFTNINPAGSDRVWVEMPDTGGLRALLKIPTVEELIRVPDARDRSAETRKYLAVNFFFDFENALDGTGNPIQNTLQNREAMLNHPRFWTWVNQTIKELADKGSEGNADPPSD